jgi:hypothetical protein
LVSNLLMMSLHNSLKKNSDRQELMFADWWEFWPGSIYTCWLRCSKFKSRTVKLPILFGAFFSFNNMFKMWFLINNKIIIIILVYFNRLLKNKPIGGGQGTGLGL